MEELDIELTAPKQPPLQRAHAALMRVGNTAVLLSHTEQELHLQSIPLGVLIKLTAQSDDKVAVQVQSLDALFLQFATTPVLDLNAYTAHLQAVVDAGLAEKPKKHIPTATGVGAGMHKGAFGAMGRGVNMMAARNKLNQLMQHTGVGAGEAKIIA